jgi:hypothetical protein
VSYIDMEAERTTPRAPANSMSASARSLVLLARYTGDHPIHRLSLSLLASFGHRDEAGARIAALRAPSDGAFRAHADPYQLWLDRLKP